MRESVLRCAGVRIFLVGAAFGFGFVGCANGDEQQADDAGDLSDDGGVAVTEGGDVRVDAAHPADATSGQDAPSSAMPDATSAGDDGSGGSGDGSSDDASPSEDSGASDDAGGDDAGSMTDASGDDASTALDAGGDSGSANDAAGMDAGSDAGGVDAGSDAGASDAGAPDANPGSDGGSTFANPIQINVTSLLTIDTVGASATGGIALSPTGALTSMDGSGYDFYTTTVASQHSVTGGLPANGLIPANGTQNPAVQRHFSDTSTAANSLMLDGPLPNNGTTFTFAVPAQPYTQLQIYATSTEGTTSLSATLTYADTTTAAVPFTIPDWGTNAATAPVFVLAGGLARLGSGTFEGHDAFALYGVNLSPDSAKVLTQVTVTFTSGKRFLFYGATGW
jgi:hypothetical protein